MANYDLLNDYLEKSGASRLRLPLLFVEAFIGKLPDSAFTGSEWWAEADTVSLQTPQCRAWRNAGYCAQFDVASRAVTFTSYGSAGDMGCKDGGSG